MIRDTLSVEAGDVRLAVYVSGPRDAPPIVLVHGYPDSAAVWEPVRAQLVALLSAHDVRLVASGHVHQRRDFTYRRIRHVWAPSVGFILPDRMQELIGIKETGLVEYRFRPDSFEVRHVRAPGQVDVTPDDLFSGRSAPGGSYGPA